MNTIIKINSKISESQIKLITSKAEKLEGVISVKIDIETSLLTYSISEWASDYDIMVAIMDIIEKENLDCEPLFEGAEEMVEIVNKHHHHEHEYEHCDCHEHHHEHEHCDCHEHEGGISFCGCSHSHGDEKEEKKRLKSRIIELSIALAIMIVGIVLSSIKSTVKFADYVYIVAFSLSGYEVIVNGIIGIFKGKPFTEDTLMMIASVSAMFLGETVEAVGIMLLYGVGETFEKTVTNDATKIINSLKSYKDETVRILGEGNIEKTISPSQVKVGDIMILRAGEKITVDGVIIEGSSSFDTKIITGENAYRDLAQGDEVLSGFTVIDGTVKIKATKKYNESAICKIADIIETSAKKKSKPEKFLEKFAKWYTPCVVIVALLLAFIPPFFEIRYLNGLKIWGVRAVMLLCVSCPCSLVISIPLCYFMGVANSAKHGVIVKNSAIIEKLASCKTVVFDKTGTLTEGELTVTKILSVKKYQGRVLELCAVAEKYSNHPIARALRKKYDNEVGDVTDYLEFAGKGVTCKYQGLKLVCGNQKFLIENGVLVNSTEHLGTKLYLAVDSEYAGTIILNDTLRKTARGAILELYDSGVTDTIMLTGDNKDYAVAVRKQLQMNKSVSELLPQDKVTELEEIMKNNQKSTVAFVGDGVNDAPVITRADVGIAMGGVGSDAVISSSDVILTTDDLSKIPYLIKLAKRTSKIAKQNLIVSLGIKFAVMVISILGISSSLWLAIGADVGLLVLTILNAIRNKINVV